MILLKKISLIALLTLVSLSALANDVIISDNTTEAPSVGGKSAESAEPVVIEEGEGEVEGEDDGDMFGGEGTEGED